MNYVETLFPIQSPTTCTKNILDVASTRGERGSTRGATIALDGREIVAMVVFVSILNSSQVVSSLGHFEDFVDLKI